MNAPTRPSPSAPSHCGRCGAALPPDAPGGNCPVCLLRAALLAPTEAQLAADALSSSSLATEGLPRRFGDYVLLAEAGRGGMGIVYRARQLSLDRPVAVKVLLFGAFARPELIARFHSEARAAAALQHPNIVAIHEIGQWEGQPFFSMDLVEGASLAELVRDRPLAPRRAAAYVRTIAAAVAYAHGRGVLHRDLKPSNILIDPHDQPRITDFGLAKRITEAATGEPLSAPTLTGQVFGSPNYMPPEQASAGGQPAGASGDIYALGALLYCLLTGRPPFVADSLQETLMQVLQAEPVPPRRLNPGVPRDLETVCLKCIEKDPRRRYPTADALAAELQRFLDGTPLQARPVGPLARLGRWARRQPALAAASGAVLLLLGAVGVGAAVAAVRLEQARRATDLAHRQTVTANQELQALNRQLTDSVADLRLQRVEALLAEGEDSAALADLAALLRQGLASPLAATRLLSVLLYRDFVLPAWPPVWHADKVVDVEFSPDGRQLVSASWDGTTQVWDALSGERMGPALRHRDKVFSAQFSPDGARVVTASGDGTARLWEVGSSRLLAELTGHTAPVALARFGADGTRVVTASWDGTARVWEGRTGQLLHELRGHAGELRVAAFSPDGGTVVTGGTDGTVRMWDAVTGAPLGQPLRHQGPLRAASFSPDGRRLLTAAEDGTARLWDAQHLAPLGEPLRHAGPVFTAQFSPDGRRVLTASEDGTAQVWDGFTGQPRGTPLRHPDALIGARFSRDGATLATYCMDYAVRLWRTESGAKFSQPLWHLAGVDAADFSPDGRRLATVSRDRSVQVWDLAPGRAQPVTLRHEGEVVAVEFDPEGRRVLTASQDRTAQVWEARTGQRLGQALRHEGPVLSAHFSPDGTRVVTGSSDHMVRIWEAATGRALMPPLRHSAPVRQAEFSPDGRWVASAAADGRVRTWDANTGRLLLDIAAHGQEVFTVRFSPDGRYLVSTAWDHTARLWDAATGMAVGPALRHRDRVNDADFSPDGRWLVTAGADDCACVWDLLSGQPRLPPLAHARWVEQARFSPDGRWIITACWDNRARVWDAARGVLHAVLPHGRRVWQSQFSADSRRVVTASSDGTARVWDVATGWPLSEPFRHEAAVRGVGFSPDGIWVVSASADHTARVWEVPSVGANVPDWLAPLAEALAGFRLTPQGSLQPLARDSLTALQHTLEGVADDDACGQVVRWFLANRTARTASPWSLSPGAGAQLTPTAEPP